MENYSIEGDEASTEKHSVEEGNINSSEEAFMQGYNDDEDVEECAECGTAVEKEKKLIKEIDGEYIQNIYKGHNQGLFFGSQENQNGIKDILSYKI